MRTAFIKALAFILLLGLAPHAWAQEGNDPVKIMVLPFDVNAGPELAYLRDSLQDLLSDRLKEAGFVVSSQEYTSRLLTEQGVEFLNLSIARDMALLGNVDYSLYGSFSQVGETISIDARLVEAFGLKPVKPVFVVREGLINLLAAVDDLVERVKNEVQREIIISSIQVKGNETLDDDVVLMRLNIQRGDPFNAADLNQELKRIYDLGYFEDVSIEQEDTAEGKRIIINVKEKPRIQAISVLGNDELDSDDIIAAMSTKIGAILNPKILADDLNTIRELYRKEGYYLAEVDYGLEGTERGQARLNILVEEGKELFIREIVIQGAETVDSDDLKSEMLTQERGFFSWFTGSGVLQEEVLERDSAAIESYYGNQGFVEAKVGQPTVDFRDDGIVITFQVVEGPRYKAGPVEFKGDLLESVDKLYDLVKMDESYKNGEWYNRSVMHKDTETLATYYSDFGYAFAEADGEIALDRENYIIHTNYRLTRNQKMRIGRLSIDGNTRTRDNVIRREMRLTDGEIFSGSKLRRSIERLKRTDYFETVDIETIPTSDPSVLDLRINLKEKTTGIVSGGVGYSSYDRFFVGGRVVETNLFGLGYRVAFQGTFSGSSSKYILNFTDPAFMDGFMSVGGDAYHKSEEFYEYDKITSGGRLRFSYPIGEYSRVYWGYRLDKYTVEDVEEGAAKAIKDVEGENWSSVFESSISRDSTDSRLIPTRGSINTVRLEYGGGILFGDDQYIKTVLESSWYFPLWWEHVLHLRGNTGMIFENFGSDEVPVFERFYLGGINDIRGYGSNLISPRDEETEDLIGGDKMWFVNLEYVVPLFSEYGMYAAFFVDAGDSRDDGDWDLWDPKKSVGTEIRWISPFGPLRFVYGYALDDVPEQGSKHKFEFSIGQVF